MNIAVIPARGGSKRIPRKNIKSFFGQPMIVWAITVAKDSGFFEQIVVSTDDLEIAEIANSHGAITPFIRPDNLANDHAGTVPVIAHAVEEMNAGGIFPEYVCCIYPCVPFLSKDDLLLAHAQMRITDADFVYPVTAYPHPIQRAMRRSQEGRMEFVFPQHEMDRTQDLESTFHDAGQFYWGKASAWLAHKKMHSSGLGMVIPSWRVVDIDNEEDWRRAELLFTARNISVENS